MFVDRRHTDALSSNECHDLLAGTPVRPADHRHGLNLWQLGDRILDFGGIDVETVDDDQLA
jgi:hypothetical protein